MQINTQGGGSGGTAGSNGQVDECASTSKLSG